MAGIPVHTASPINPKSPSNPSGVTPSTAAARYAPPDSPSRASQTPATNPATSTVFTSPKYRAAQPGSAAGPTPTSAPQSPLTFHHPAPTARLPSLSTRTASSPPPPQPGTVPSPSTYTEARRASIPPPPKAGEVPKPAAFYAPKYDGTSLPASPRALALNTSIPPLATHQTQGTLLTPTLAQPPASVTASMATTTPTTTTTTGGKLPNDLSHPPGYVQDSRASFLERLPELMSPLSLNQSSSTGGHSRGRSRTGILDGGGGSGDMDDAGEKGLWDTAVSWAKTVGEKVNEGEDEVWKRINGKK